MKAIVPKSWNYLPKSEKEKIGKLMDEQIETLDEEMRTIFKKSGYPDQFFKGIFGEAWEVDTSCKEKR